MGDDTGGNPELGRPLSLEPCDVGLVVGVGSGCLVRPISLRPSETGTGVGTTGAGRVFSGLRVFPEVRPWARVCTLPNSNSVQVIRKRIGRRGIFCCIGSPFEKLNNGGGRHLSSHHHNRTSSTRTLHCYILPRWPAHFHPTANGKVSHLNAQHPHAPHVSRSRLDQLL